MLLAQINRRLERAQGAQRGLTALVPYKRANDNKEPCAVLPREPRNEIPPPPEEEVTQARGIVCGVLLPPDVHAALKARAQRNKTTLKTEVLRAVMASL